MTALLIPLGIRLPLGVWLVILVIGGGFALVGGVNGLRKPPSPETFTPTIEETKHFVDPPELVLAAYRAAAAETPGMTIAQEGPGWLYLDSRPTARIMNGDFGSALGVKVTPAGTGSAVVTQYAPKSTANLVSNYEAAFREKERALRMAAKRFGGLTEAV